MILSQLGEDIPIPIAEIDIEKVNSLGIQISDKQEGEFILEIKYIKAIY